MDKRISAHLVILIAIASALANLPAARAQSASGGNTGTNSNHAVVPIPTNTALDLGSTSQTVQSPNSTSIQITEGGVMHTIAPGQMVTPGEFMAVRQVVANWGQHLVLSGSGAAIGGYAGIGTSSVSNLQNLNIPTNVSLTAFNFNAASPLTVLGVTNVAGTLNAVQTHNNVTAVINSGSLNVLPGGMITTNAPAFFGTGNILPSAALSINVVDKFLNQGIIQSAGALNIMAGGQIFNQSTLTSTATMIAASVTLSAPTIANSGTIEALRNATISATAGTIINQGLISSVKGDVNLTAADQVNLDVRNNNGTIEALQGSINVRNTEYDGKADITLKGGDFLSETLNVNAGHGAAFLDAGNISGTVNVPQACSLHIDTATSNLKLGTINVEGDPTFYNTSGDVTLTGSITTGGADLAVLAKGNIGFGNGTPPYLSIDTSSSSGNGGNVLFVAGASLSAPINGQQVNNDTTSAITITGASVTGGNINLLPTSAYFTSLNTGSTFADGKGGNVTMVAYNGYIFISPGAAVNTSGNSAGSNGNVSMIAGLGANNGPYNNAGSAIWIGPVTATGGSGGGGIVSLAAAQPKFVGGTQIVVQNGSVLAGSASFGFNNGGSANVQLDGSITANQIAVTASNYILMQGNLAAPNGVALTTYGTGYGGLTGSGSITSPGQVLVNIGNNNVSTVNVGLNGSGNLTAAGIPLTTTPSVLGISSVFNNVNLTSSINLGSGSLSISSNGANILLNSYTLTANGGIVLSVTGTGTIGTTTNPLPVISSTGLIALSYGSAQLALGPSSSNTYVQANTFGVGGNVGTLAIAPSYQSLSINTGSAITFSGSVSTGGSLSVFTPSTINTQGNGLTVGGSLSLFATGAVTTGTLSTSGNATITGSGVTTGSFTSTNGSIAVTSAGNLTVNGPMSAVGITLSTSKGGNITLGGNISSSAPVSFQTVFQSGVFTGANVSLTSGTISAPGITFNAANDIYGTTDSSSTPILTATPVLSVVANNGFISNSGAVSVNATLYGSQFLLVTTGPGANITTSGNIAFSGITWPATLSLIANGNITISDTISAPTINLQTAAGSGGSITINTAAVHPGTMANPANILGVLGTTVNITADANGNISIVGVATGTTGIAGTNMLLQTSGAGSILSGSDYSYISSDSALTLKATGSGNISARTIFSPSVNFQTGSGDIYGASDNSSNPVLLLPFLIGYPNQNINITVNTTSGSAYLFGTNADVTLGASSVGNQLQIATTCYNNFVPANLTVSGSVQATGGLNLVAYGNITLTANAGSSATTTLQAQGPGSISQTSGTVSGSVLNLTSNSGNISGIDLSHPLYTAASQLTVSAAPGNSNFGNVYISNAGELTVGQSTVGNQLKLNTTGTNAAITISGTITTLTGLNLLGTGAISQTGGTITGSIANFQTSSGNISANSITAPSVILQATTGSIGSSLAPVILTNSSTTNISATAGQSVYLSILGTANFTSTPYNNAANNGTFSVTAANGITANAGTTLTGNNIVLTATAGSIGSSSSPLTLTGTVQNLTTNAASAGQSLYLNALSSATLSGTSSVSSTGTFNLTANGTIGATSGSSIVANSINLVSQNGSIGSSTTSVALSSSLATVSATATAPGQSVYLSGSGSMNVTALADTGSGKISISASNNITALAPLSAYTVSLASTSGGIGSSSNPITLTAATINVSASAPSASQSVYVNALGSINVSANSGANTLLGTFSLTAANNLTAATGTTMSASNVYLTATTGGFTLNGTISGGSSGLVSLTSSQSMTGATLTNVSGGNLALTSTAGNVTFANAISSFANSISITANTGGTGSISATGGLYTESVNLSSGTGGITVSSTTATTLSANSTGSVSVTDSASTLNLVLNASSAGNGNTFTLTASSANIDLAGNLQAASGTIGTVNLTSCFNLTNSAGTITGTTVKLTSTQSNIWLSNTVTGSGAGGAITLSAAPGNYGGIQTQTLSAPNVTLTAGDGIHVNSTSATSLTANIQPPAGLTGNTVFIIDTAPGTVTLKASSAGAGGDFQLYCTSAALNLAGNLKSTTTTPMLSVYLDAANNITNTAGTIVATQINLTSESGSIVLSNSVTSVASGGYYQLVELSQYNTITSTGLSFISTPNLGLISTNGNIALTTQLATGATSVYLDASPYGSPAGTSSISSTFSVNTQSLVLVSGSGGISNLHTSATSLAANSSGPVSIVDTTTAKLNLGAGSGGSLGAAGSTFTLTTSGSIDIAANVATTTSVSLTAATSITDSTSSNIVSPSITLKAQGTGSIGTSTVPVIIGTGSQMPVVTATAPGSVYLNALGAIGIAGSGNLSTGTYSVSGVGDIIGSGTVSALNVTLATTGGNIYSPGVNQISPLVIGNNGSRTNVTCTVPTDFLIDISTLGSANFINSSGGQIFVQCAGTLRITNVSATTTDSGIVAAGNVYSAGTPSGSIIGFTQTGGGTLSITGGITATQNPTAVAIAAGNIYPGIFIQNNSTASTAAISIGSGIALSSYVNGAGVKSLNSQGRVTLEIGPSLASSPNGGSLPGSITVSQTAPGVAQLLGYAGLGGVTGPASGTASVTALGANVVLSTYVTGQHITFATNSSVYADPPVSNGLMLQTSGDHAVLLDGGAARSGTSTHAVHTINGDPAMIRFMDFKPTFDVRPAMRSPLADDQPADQVESSDAQSITFFDRSQRDFGSSTKASVTAADSKLTRVSYIQPVNGMSSQRPLCVVRVSNTGEIVTMPHGRVLFAPPQTITVRTSLCSVRIASGAAALVVATKNSVAVYDLHDRNNGDIRVAVTGRTVDLSPGRHLLLTEQQITSYEQVNPLPSVGHRRLTRTQISNGVCAFSSEFSLFSVLANLKSQIHIGHAANIPGEESKVLNSMLKDAAALMQMEPASEPYTRLAKK